MNGLRPTPDRVRETLFNWLAPGLPGARCLDLFAGTGALGLEALSRGAAHVVFVEQNPLAADTLKSTCNDLKARHADVVRSDVLAFLATSPAGFDLVLIDAPYDSALHDRVCRELDAGGWLAPGARVYVETARDRALVAPATWRPLREDRIGQVHSRLYEVP